MSNFVLFYIFYVSSDNVITAEFTKDYRGSLPYATFGTWKKLHYPKIALEKSLFYVRSNKINSP